MSFVGKGCDGWDVGLVVVAAVLVVGVANGRVKLIRSSGLAWEIVVVLSKVDDDDNIDHDDGDDDEDEYVDGRIELPWIEELVVAWYV